jgi:endonuclease-3
MRAAQRRSTRILATAATKTKISPKPESASDVSEASQSPDHEKPNPPTKEEENAESSNGDEQKVAKPTAKSTKDHDVKLKDAKWQKWSTYANSSPFPNFKHPTPRECKDAYAVLHDMHREAVDEEFKDEYTPETIPHVLDAMIVAILSQATNWNNAKCAMGSMKETYGSIYAYDKIMSGGREKLQEALKCGGLHVRKSMIISTILAQVQERHGKWDLDHLFQASDEDAMQELMSYKYMGPKSASVVMGWCLKRNRFTVDVHIYRIAGLWGWRPEKATRELTQSHLDAVVPSELKFMLHFLILQHGRECPACRGGARKNTICEAQKKIRQKRK